MMADVISSRNSPKGWQRLFEDPIPLPRGRELVTLEDAARYIQKLPKAEQQLDEWQTAVETLILVAETNGGPTMIAGIGILPPHNRHLQPAVHPDRQDTHLGTPHR